mgnify:CR=1 FL=1
MYTYDDVKEHSNDREYVEKAIEKAAGSYKINCKTNNLL